MEAGSAGPRAGDAATAARVWAAPHPLHLPAAPAWRVSTAWEVGAVGFSSEVTPPAPQGPRGAPRPVCFQGPDSAGQGGSERGREGPGHV